jgi:hypothetical protein
VLRTSGNKYPWFSGKLKIYVKKKQLFVCFKNFKTGCLWDNIYFCSELVKTTVKCDRLYCLKFVDENLRSELKEFWNYVSKLKVAGSGGETYLLHLQIDGIS